MLVLGPRTDFISGDMCESMAVGLQMFAQEQQIHGRAAQFVWPGEGQ